uniref:Uncharacterized protein n=1 Tax=Phaeomonas parva TaxID=124430 RepID=A0A7S1UCI5_9STRA
MEEELRGKEAALRDATDRIQYLTEEGERTDEVLEELRGDLAASEATCDGQARELEQLRGDLAAANEIAEMQHHDAERSMRDLREALHAKVAALDDAVSDAQQTSTGQLDAARQRAAEAEAALQEVTAELEAAQGQLQGAEAARQAMAAELEAARQCAQGAHAVAVPQPAPPAAAEPSPDRGRVAARVAALEGQLQERETTTASLEEKLRDETKQHEEHNAHMRQQVARLNASLVQKDTALQNAKEKLKGEQEANATLTARVDALEKLIQDREDTPSTDGVKAAFDAKWQDELEAGAERERDLQMQCEALEEQMRELGAHLDNARASAAKEAEAKHQHEKAMLAARQDLAKMQKDYEALRASTQVVQGAVSEASKSGQAKHLVDHMAGINQRLQQETAARSATEESARRWQAEGQQLRDLLSASEAATKSAEETSRRWEKEATELQARLQQATEAARESAEDNARRWKEEGDDLRSRLQDLASARGVAEESARRAQQDVDAIRARFDEVSTAKVAAEESSQRWQKECSDVQGRLMELAKAKADAEEASKAHQAQLSEKLAASETIKQDAEKLQAMLQTAQQACAEAKDKAASAERDRTSDRARLEAAEKRRDELVEAGQQQKKLLGDVQAKLDEGSASALKLETEKAQAEADMERAKVHLEKAMAEKDRVISKLEQSELEKLTLQDELAVEAVRRGALEARVQSLEAESRALQSHQREVESSFDLSQLQQEELQTELSIIKSVLEEHEKRNASFQETDEQRTQLEEDLRTTQISLRRSEEENEALTRQLKAKAQTIKVLKSSAELELESSGELLETKSAVQRLEDENETLLRELKAKEHALSVLEAEAQAGAKVEAVNGNGPAGLAGLRPNPLLSCPKSMANLSSAELLHEVEKGLTEIATLWG